MFEVKHFGWYSRDERPAVWSLLRARTRRYFSLADACKQAREWVDAEGGQAQIFSGQGDDVYENGRLINVYEHGRFWR